MFCIAHSPPKPLTGMKSMPKDLAHLPVLSMMLVATYRTLWSNANEWHIYLEIPKNVTAKFLSWLATHHEQKASRRFLKIQCYPVIPSRGPPIGHKLDILGQITPLPKENEAEHTITLDVVPKLPVNDFISSIEDGLERWEATHNETYDLDTREWVIYQLDLFGEKVFMDTDATVTAAKADILKHWMDQVVINHVPLGTNVRGPLPRRPRRRHGGPPADSSLS